MPPPVTPKWIVHPKGPEAATRQLAESAGVHPLVAEILYRRGVDNTEAAQRFLTPRLEHLHDPFLLKGMQEAVERIARALAHGERIVVSGDYDVDGITSTALLTEFLRAAGATALDYFIPNRFDHGYGLTNRTVEALLGLAPRLIITVDNGITAIEEVGDLNRAGVDTIITDHHLPRLEGVPPGIVVNPQQPGCAYPCKAISGVGVAFKLATALRKHLRDTGWWNDKRPEPNLKNCLDLTAIGTVADIVPLVEENRVLVHQGLAVLNRQPRRPGVQALLDVSAKNSGSSSNRSAVQAEKPVTARTIGFQIGPRLNAAGRMTEGALGVQLLLADDETTATQLAERLDEENTQRRTLGEQMYKTAIQAIEAMGADGEEGGDTGAQTLPGLVVASPDFHEGIIGIVASRLVDRYHCPVVVLAQNGESLKGSARSIPGINVTEAISACQHLLDEWGGHAGAGGCKFHKEKLEAFRADFAAACAKLAANAEPPAVYLEERLNPEQLEPGLVEQLERLAPFGQNHEEPTFLVEQAALRVTPDVLAEKHLKWKLSPQLEMVAWNRAESLNPHAANDYRVRVGFNEFRGVRRIQLTVDQVRGEA